MSPPRATEVLERRRQPASERELRSFDGEFVRLIDGAIADELIEGDHAVEYRDHVRLKPGIRAAALQSGSHRAKQKPSWEREQKGAWRIPASKGALKWKPRLADGRPGAGASPRMGKLWGNQ